MQAPRTIKLKILMAFLLVGFILLNLSLINFAQSEEKTEGEKIINVECPQGSQNIDNKCVAPLDPKTKTCEKKTLEFYYDSKLVGCVVVPLKVIKEGDIKKIEPIKIQAFETSVDIPCQPIAGGKCPEPTTLAGYIARLYQFGLMIAGLTAFGAIVFGALKYILSAGNIASQQDARDQITQAIIGLILLLGAYLILYTINPDLVSLRNPSAEIINIEEIIRKQEKNVFVGKEQELPTDTGEVPLIENCKTAMKTQFIVGGKQKIGSQCLKCIEGYTVQEDKNGQTWCKPIGMD